MIKVDIHLFNMLKTAILAFCQSIKPSKCIIFWYLLGLDNENEYTIGILIKSNQNVCTAQETGKFSLEYRKTDIFKIAAIQYLEFGSENVIKKYVYIFLLTFRHFY